MYVAKEKLLDVAKEMSTALVTIVCDKLSFYFGRIGKDRHV